MSHRPRTKSAPHLVPASRAYPMTAAEVEGIAALAAQTQILQQRMEAIAQEAKARFGLPLETPWTVDLQARLWKDVPHAQEALPAPPPPVSQA